MNHILYREKLLNTYKFRGGRDTEVSSDKLFEYTTGRLDKEVDTSRARITRMLYVNGFLFSAFVDRIGTISASATARAYLFTSRSLVGRNIEYVAMRCSYPFVTHPSLLVRQDDVSHQF